MTEEDCQLFLVVKPIKKSIIHGITDIEKIQERNHRWYDRFSLFPIERCIPKFSLNTNPTSGPQWSTALNMNTATMCQDKRGKTHR